MSNIISLNVYKSKGHGNYIPKNNIISIIIDNKFEEYLFIYSLISSKQFLSDAEWCSEFLQKVIKNSIWKNAGHNWYLM